MATHVRARESEGTACVVVVSGMRFESYIYVYIVTEMALIGLLNIGLAQIPH